ncbi:MAG: gamma-glutamyltransferase, partial [Sandaracinobacteroides sp.]
MVRMSDFLVAAVCAAALSAVTLVTAQAQTNVTPAPAPAPSPAPALAPAPEGATGRTQRALGYATQHMVAAANPLAAEAGRQILRAGGSAVDAAIAVQLVLNLVEPQSSGIGGGAFMVHWDQARRKTTTLDGRET